MRRREYTHPTRQAGRIQNFFSSPIEDTGPPTPDLMGPGVCQTGAMSDLSGEFAELHAQICKGLADPKRLLILNALRGGERSVNDLCDELDLPQANVSQHLAVLRERGLASTRRDGQRIFYSVSSPKIIQAMDLLREVMREHSTAVGV